MTQTQFFEWLGAPLKNSRWSWGAIRSDGIIFLRVWQDQSIKLEGKRYVRATYHSKVIDERSNLGHQERLLHIAELGRGSSCYLVMCKADPELFPAREIIDFDANDLFLVGDSVEIDGDTWLELKLRVPAMSVRKGT
jgi:hypothetical protein